MLTRYTDYFGHQVSRPWNTVLRAADRHKVGFHLNQGHRTIAEQARFYWCYLTKRCNAGRLAAHPTPSAPHIRVGHANHAIDVQSTDGGAQRLAHWLRHHHVHATFPVPGEDWHIEAPEGQLRAFARRIRKHQRAHKRHLRRIRRRR